MSFDEFKSNISVGENLEILKPEYHFFFYGIPMTETWSPYAGYPRITVQE